MSCKSNKKEILGFTAGNFDLLHPGYIITFEEAKKHCDRFIVFLQRDPSLHRSSKYKPVIPLYDRYKALMSIKYIDEVYIFQTEEELYALSGGLETSVQQLRGLKNFTPFRPLAGGLQEQLMGDLTDEEIRKRLDEMDL